MCCTIMRKPSKQRLKSNSMMIVCGLRQEWKDIKLKLTILENKLHAIHSHTHTHTHAHFCPARVNDSVISINVQKRKMLFTVLLVSKNVSPGNFKFWTYNNMAPNNDKRAHSVHTEKHTIHNNNTSNENVNDEELVIN